MRDHDSFLQHLFNKYSQMGGVHVTCDRLLQSSPPSASDSYERVSIGPAGATGAGAAGAGAAGAGAAGADSSGGGGGGGGGKAVPCVFFFGASGSCRRGARCPFSHGKQSEQHQRQPEKLPEQQPGGVYIEPNLPRLPAPRQAGEDYQLPDAKLPGFAFDAAQEQHKVPLDPSTDAIYYNDGAEKLEAVKRGIERGMRAARSTRSHQKKLSPPPAGGHATPVLVVGQ